MRTDRLGRAEPGGEAPNTGWQQQSSEIGITILTLRVFSSSQSRHVGSGPISVEYLTHRDAFYHTSTQSRVLTMRF